MTMRKINRVILHCSATPASRPVTVDEIRRWHVQGNGWRDIGYHWVVMQDGSVHPGRPESETGAHVAGHNADSIGVCYVGGLDDASFQPTDTRTPEQRAAMYRLIEEIQARHSGKLTVHGHNEFAAKACPCYDVQEDMQHYRLNKGRKPVDAPAPAETNPFAAAIAFILSLFRR